jgi:hypothetical protein
LHPARRIRGRNFVHLIRLASVFIPQVRTSGEQLCGAAYKRRNVKLGLGESRNKLSRTAPHVPAHGASGDFLAGFLAGFGIFRELLNGARTLWPKLVSKGRPREVKRRRNRPFSARSLRLTWPTGRGKLWIGGCGGWRFLRLPRPDELR